MYFMFEVLSRPLCGTSPSIRLIETCKLHSDKVRSNQGIYIAIDRAYLDLIKSRNDMWTTLDPLYTYHEMTHKQYLNGHTSLLIIISEQYNLFVLDKTI